jgi:hypothetical protein
LEEDRLAAEISTIGLQARKLSGAQRKKLIRERKMREGTWPESKPPRKTSSSGDTSCRSAGGILKQYITLYAAARLWIASAIMFLGIWSLNRQTYVQSQSGTSASSYEARGYGV